MAAPTYSTDLVDIITDPTSSTGWTLISSGGGGANSFTVPETDDYIQSATPGTYGCISRNPFSSSIRGMVYNSSQTVTAGNAVFIWTKSDVAQALASKASGGIQALIGSGTGDLKCYYVSGNDDAFGGWKCYPIDPTVTQSTNIGSPTSTTAYFGVRWNVPSSGPSKGYPFKIDAIRRGRTLQMVAGESGNYATIAGASTYGGDTSRRWGLLFYKDGSYFWQGRLLLGVTGGTAVNFVDSNRAIFVQNTEFVGSTFNTIEVQHASSVVTLTNVSIQALGTVSKGRFLVTDNATVTLDGCTFTDMGTFTLKSNTTATGSTFRRCDTITSGGATFDACLIANSPATASVTASAASDVGNFTDCTFVSDGSNHAIDLGTVSSSASYSWNNYLTNYASSNGSTGNEAIKVNVATSQTLTINVGTGYDTPSVYNTGSGTVNVVSSSTLTINIVDADGNAITDACEVTVVRNSDTTTLYNAESVTTGTTAYAYSSGSGTVVYINIHNVTGYQSKTVNNHTLASGNETITVQLDDDPFYNNP